MTSGFSGNFSPDDTTPSGGPRRLISTNPATLLQQQQQGTMLLTNHNTTRRSNTTDLLIGKRSFSDFQSFHNNNYNNININFSQQQSQQFTQQQPLSFQQQYLLMRSLRQKTDSFLSSPSSTRLGLPVYQQQPQQQQQQQQLAVSLLNNNYSHSFNALNNNVSDLCNVNNFKAIHNNCSANNLLNPGLRQTQYPNSISGPGFLNPTQPDPKLETNKIMNTLQELEKELLNDDGDDENNNLSEPDPVSGITNSEWSETFQNLIEPGLGLNPVQNGSKNNPGTLSTTGSNNSVNNNSMISSSPTSSTSSCCSTSASPATGPPVSINQLINEATVAISDGKLDVGKETLMQLFKVVNQRGSSEQRLGFYMAHALQSRAWPNKNSSVIELYRREQLLSDYLLHEMSPCFKFGLLAANLVLLDAINFGVQEKKKIHLIDFHVGHAGGQYVKLLRALGERRYHSRVALKITLVNTEVGHGSGNNECGESETVRNSLLVLAEEMGINFEFEVLTRRIAELTRESLSCDESEVVLVNFAFWVYRVPDESVSVVNLRDELLRRVKGLSPRAVTLVEQDMNANTAPFVTRVNESCSYYGALFDSLELTRDNPDRVRVEEGLGRKLLNAVGCEGPQRVERTEVFGKWRARMGMAGFELKPLSQSLAESMRVKLNSVRGGNPGFTVKEENGGLSFGWKGKPITIASAWR